MFGQSSLQRGNMGVSQNASERSHIIDLAILFGWLETDDKP